MISTLPDSATPRLFSSRVLSWFITPITRVYGTYNYSYWGESKPTNITGGPHIVPVEIENHHHCGTGFTSSGVKHASKKAATAVFTVDIDPRLRLNKCWLWEYVWSSYIAFIYHLCTIHIPFIFWLLVQ